MFNIGPFEFMLIFTVALIVFGPQKLPEVARFLGKVTREVQKFSSGAYNMWNEAVREQNAPPANKTQDNEPSLEGQAKDQEEKKEGPDLPDEKEKPY